MSFRPLLCLIALLAGGCAFVTDADEEKRLDPDGDGVIFPNDCNDDDDQVGGPETFYVDADGDTFGDLANTVSVCLATVGQVRDSSDCNDGDPSVYPGADEVPYDAIDQDCDAADVEDVDADGYRAAEVGGDDCDDSDAAIHPDAVDAWYDGVDADCAGNSDNDADADGYDAVEMGGDDCDDQDASRFPDPTVEEIFFTGFDENCDGTDGDGDVDGDGYWDPDYYDKVAAGGNTVEVFVPNTDDCWDGDGSTVPTAFIAVPGFEQPGPGEVYPGATDTWYDGVDQDCDLADDFDQDADGYRTDQYADIRGFKGEDCDDTEPLTNPGVAYDAPYDGVDADCDDWDDNDFDRDGYASDATGGSDCLDDEPAVNPGVREVCDNGVDDDCDGGARLCGLTTGVQADTEADVSLNGTGGAYLGYAMEACGDANGDGKDDVFIGAPGSSVFKNSGGVASYYRGGFTSSSSANMRLAGDEDYGNFGMELDCGEDLDNSGNTDFVAASPYRTEMASYGGSVHVSYGPPGGLASASTLGHLASSYSSAYFGSDLFLSEDISGDGVADLVVASPGVELVQVLGGGISLSPGVVVEASTYEVGSVRRPSGGTYEEFGSEIAESDLNGDGYADLVVAAISASDLATQCGIVYVFAGPVNDARSVDDYDAALIGVNDFEYAGSALNGEGDFNGDGAVDLLINGIKGGGSGEGVVYVVQGGASFWTGSLSGADAILTGSLSSSEFGASLDTIPDIDGDGDDELLVGAPSAPYSYGGAAYIFEGPLAGAVTTSAADGEVAGTTAYQGFGMVARYAGDVDGDGDGDVMIAAPYGGSTSYDGIVHFFYGGGL